MKLTISILLFCFVNTPQGFNDRRIIIISAQEDNLQVKNQINWLQKNSLELEKRRLAVFTFIGAELKPILNSTEQSKIFVEKNKTDYAPATSSPIIYLIGLDKSVKQTFTDLVKPYQIFDKVDSMPMRRAEMREN